MSACAHRPEETSFFTPCASKDHPCQCAVEVKADEASKEKAS